MNANETAELLRYLRSSLQGGGFADLDQLLVRSRLSDIRNSGLQLLAYLGGLRDEIALGSQGVGRETLARLRQFPTEDGQPIRGVVIDVVDADVAVYGTRRIDLVGSPAVDALVEQLEALLRDLRASIDLPGLGPMEL